MIIVHGMENAERIARNNGVKENIVRSFEKAGKCLQAGGVESYVLIVSDEEGRMLIQKNGLNVKLAEMQIAAIQSTLEDCIDRDSKLMRMWKNTVYNIIRSIHWMIRKGGER